MATLEMWLRQSNHGWGVPTKLVPTLTHKKYVAQGKCPSTNHGMWCFGNSGHSGDHRALDLRPMIKAQYIFWPQTSGDSSRQQTAEGR